MEAAHGILLGALPTLQPDHPAYRNILKNTGILTGKPAFPAISLFFKVCVSQFEGQFMSPFPDRLATHGLCAPEVEREAQCQHADAR